MPNENVPARTYYKRRRYDVGLTPMIIVEIVDGQLYSVDTTFDDPVAFVGNPETGNVVDALTLFDPSVSYDMMDEENRAISDAARVAARIIDDPVFQNAVRRAAKECVARYC